MAEAFFAATESDQMSMHFMKRLCPRGQYRPETPRSGEQWPKPKPKPSKVRESKFTDPHTHGQGATLEYVGPSNPEEQKHAPTGAPQTAADEFAHATSVQQQRRDEEKMMTKRAKRAMIEADRNKMCVRGRRGIS